MNEQQITEYAKGYTHLKHTYLRYLLYRAKACGHRDGVALWTKVIELKLGVDKAALP